MKIYTLILLLGISLLGDKVYAKGKHSWHKLDDSTISKPLKRNTIACNPLGFFAGNIHLSYERLTKTGTIGFRAHMSYSYPPFWRYHGMNALGLDINFYPFPKRKVKFYYGPGARAGTSQNKDWEKIWAITFHNGVAVRPTKWFSMGLQWGGGIGRNTKEMFTYGYVAFNLGVCF